MNQTASTTRAGRAGPQQDVIDVVKRRLRLNLVNPGHLNRDHAHDCAIAVMRDLRDAGLINGVRQHSGEEVMAKWADRGVAMERGVSQLVAEVFVLLNLPKVRNSLVFALLPESIKASQGARRKFSAALRQFDQWGWITRHHDGPLSIHQPDRLAAWFEASEPADQSMLGATLDIAAATRAVRLVDPAEPISTEQREREIRAVDRLMRQAPGAKTGERGQVRVLAARSPL